MYYWSITVQGDLLLIFHLSGRFIGSLATSLALPILLHTWTQYIQVKCICIWTKCIYVLYWDATPSGHLHSNRPKQKFRNDQMMIFQRLGNCKQSRRWIWLFLDQSWNTSTLLSEHFVNTIFKSDEYCWIWDWPYGVSIS